VYLNVHNTYCRFKPTTVDYLAELVIGCKFTMVFIIFILYFYYYAYAQGIITIHARELLRTNPPVFHQNFRGVPLD